MAQQTIVDIAKAPFIAYNDKNWDAVRTSLATGATYDELGTQRTIQGVEEIITAWRGWATAIPDSRATFNATCTSGDTVVLELTWRGTQTGPLQTPGGTIPPSGKKIDLRACQVIEVAGNKVRTIRNYFDVMTLLQQIGAGASAMGAASR